MTRGRIPTAAMVLGVAVVTIAAPLLFPAYQTQLTLLWIMILFALSWDIMGGQMGYNSFGNILFFGAGMYACVAIQVGLFVDLAEYTAASGAVKFAPDPDQYLIGLAVGLAAAAVIAVALAVVLGSGLLGLRGQYFAIATLGLGITAGEIASGWDLIGAGSGMVAPGFPEGLERFIGRGDARGLFYYAASAVLAIACFLTLRKVYRSRFGLAINAIRDDEDKAEAMGLHTTRYKTVAWSISAFFLSLAGGLAGNVLIFVDPRDTAFTGATYGVWMVLMAILGGKGTLWGPVLGAVVFHVTQEIFWTSLLGWQRVALGLLIVVIVVFLPQGIMGWVRERWPERFGEVVDAKTPAGGGS